MTLSLMLRSIVNRHFSVPEAAFSMKLELVSQTRPCVQLCTVCHKTQKQRSNIDLFKKMGYYYQNLFLFFFRQSGRIALKFVGDDKK